MTGQTPTEADGALIAARLFDLTGLVLDQRYVIGPRIGVGSMGVVYQATHRAIGRKVAIKLLRGEHTGNATFRRRFEREARSASRIRHPNVVEVLDFGELEGGPLYIVMEFLAGSDLREILQREGAIEGGRARGWLRELMAAIAAAHDANIIHRDIKPANCFITRTGDDRESVKVLDFGVARLEDDTAVSALTGISEVVGSVAYIAPELVTGATASVASDIYAIGVMAHEVLSGQHPFPGSDIYDIMNKHLRMPPPALPSTAPPDLRTIIERALQKEPNLRFGSVHEMLGKLDPDAPHQRVKSRPTGAPRATAMLPQRPPSGASPSVAAAAPTAAPTAAPAAGVPAAGAPAAGVPATAAPAAAGLLAQPTAAPPRPGPSPRPSPPSLARRPPVKPRSPSGPSFAAIAFALLFAVGTVVGLLLAAQWLVQRITL